MKQREKEDERELVLRELTSIREEDDKIGGIRLLARARKKLSSTREGTRGKGMMVLFFVTLERNRDRSDKMNLYDC